MTIYFTHIRFRHRLFQFGILSLFLLAVGIFAGQFRESVSPLRIEEGEYEGEDEYLEGVTSKEMFAFRENNPFLVLPQDLEKSREIVRQCEELWNELQEFKNEPDFSSLSLLAGETRHHDWLQRAETRRNSLPSKEEIGSDVHALPGALIAAALDLAGQKEFPRNCSAEKWFADFYLPAARNAVQPNL